MYKSLDITLLVLHHVFKFLYRSTFILVTYVSKVTHSDERVSITFLTHKFFLVLLTTGFKLGSWNPLDLEFDYLAIEPPHHPKHLRWCLVSMPVGSQMKPGLGPSPQALGFLWGLGISSGSQLYSTRSP